jgi:rhamnulokinase
MTSTLDLLALDLGAESGRAILGRFDGEHLSIEEVHRFGNGPVRAPWGLQWDALRLWSEIKTGIGKAALASGGQLAGIGIDTWGVDFALLDRAGTLIGNPYHYRDGRTDGMLERAFQLMPRDEIFAHTGVQFMQINTLYQLLAMALNDSPALAAARTFLAMPDLFNYLLTGQAVGEFSIATTTQCYDPRRRTWADPVLAALGIPRSIFPALVDSGATLGPLRSEVAAEVGAATAVVIAPAGHDTGSAVAAVPAEQADFAWISSGTWSVMGILSPEAVISPQSLAYNFTNEGAAGGAFRFCKNIMGLWLLQECRRTWAAQGEALSYGQITDMAAASRPFVTIVDVDDGDFLKPGDMAARIEAFGLRTGQSTPANKGETARSILESLALKYRLVLERLEEMTGRRIAAIHIVGGGTQNHLLNQMTADATGRLVVTGPIEATAIGNLLIQAVALGSLGSLSEASTVVRASFPVTTFEPGDPSRWDAAYARLLSLLS